LKSIFEDSVMDGLIDVHFLPSLEYFCALQNLEKIALEKHEHFSKQSYRNRCYILASQGRERLTVPLVATHRKVMITEVEVDYTARWQANFLRTLESAYAKAPYYEHYISDLKKEILSNHKYLYDLNVHLMSMCLQWLKWDKLISESVSYDKNPDAGTIDLRSRILAKKEYLDRDFYYPKPYQQVFGSNFVPNLSIVDLVFCEGPYASSLLKASGKKN
jgi:hypothetical protein